MRYRFWYAADTLMHKLHLHIGWVCDRFDSALGLYDDSQEISQ